MLKRCDFRARRKEGCESISLLLTGRLFQMSGPQTEKARRPNWVLVRRTAADLVVVDRSWRRWLGSTDAECDEVFKIWRGTIMEDIASAAADALTTADHCMRCRVWFCCTNFKFRSQSNTTILFLVTQCLGLDGISRPYLADFFLRVQLFGTSFIYLFTVY